MITVNHAGPPEGRKKAMHPAVQAVLGLSLAVAFAIAGRQPKTPKKFRSDDGPAAQLSKAPPSAKSLRNPFSGEAGATAAGHKLFEQHCAECHGSDARGLDRAADLHSATIQDAPPGVLFWALRNGRIRKGMPSWAHLPDQQLWQIVTYLKTLQ